MTKNLISFYIISEFEKFYLVPVRYDNSFARDDLINIFLFVLNEHLLLVTDY